MTPFDHDTVTPYQQDKAKKEQVEEMFDNIAHRYDFLNRFLSAGFDQGWRKRAIKEMGKIKPKSILDVATGTADLAIAEAVLKPDKIVGVDLSKEMLAKGQIKVEKRNLQQLISLEQADAENLPFDNNTFDAVSVAFGVRNFANLTKGLSEILRVMRVGGKLAILEVSKPTVFPVKQVFGFYFKVILPFVGKNFSKDHRAYTYLPESVEAFPQGDSFLQILQSVGFKNSKCTRLTFGICSMYIAEK